MRELAARSRRNADSIPTVYKRSSFIEWNFNSEVYAFDKRLNENFDLKLLSQAFHQRSYIIQEQMRLEKSGVDVNEIQLSDNQELAVKGRAITTSYVQAFLRYHLPRLPDEGITAVQNYLLSTEKLAHISANLGTKEIILAEEYPASDESLATTLFAIIGALNDSQTDGQLTRPHNFVRDFICTHLNQVELSDVWQIEKPYEVLQSVCAAQGIASIEPRILGQVSKADLLFCCRIGIYDGSSKKLLGSSYGDNYDNGIEAAALDALTKFFGIFNLKPFDYTIAPNKLFSQAKQQIAN